MIKCPQCGNESNFIETHIGGYRKHQYTQESNGRLTFEGSNYDRVEDTFLNCGKCNYNISNQYRKFLEALFQLYDEKKHGP